MIEGQGTIYKMISGQTNTSLMGCYNNHLSIRETLILEQARLIISGTFVLSSISTSFEQNCSAKAPRLNVGR